jgi:hypothetical protein
MLPEFQNIPRAGNNVLILVGNTKEENDRRISLIERLDKYEQYFMEMYEKDPSTEESNAHLSSLFHSGLTEKGLSQARAFAGKKCSFRPGVFFPCIDRSVVS